MANPEQTSQSLLDRLRVNPLEEDRERLARFCAPFLKRWLSDRSLVEERFEAAWVKAFRRYFLDGLKSDAVAKELDIPVHTVYNAKTRILKFLRTEGEGLLE